MMNNEKAQNSNNEIKISSDIPAARAASAFLIFFGTVVAILPQLAQNRDELSPFLLAGLLGAGIMAIGAGIAVGNSAKRIDVFYRRSDAILRIARKGWFSSRLEMESIPCSDVREVGIENSEDSEGTPCYQLKLQTKSGRAIQVSESSYSKELILEKKAVFDDAIFNGANETNRLLQKSRAKKQIPGPLICTVAVVTAAPFLAAVVADHVNLSKIEITSGIPDRQTITQMQAMAAGALRSTENILWVGQPELGRESAVKMWMMIPFSIAWTLFSLLWISVAYCVARQSKNIFVYGFVLFGLPFVLIGLGLLCSPYFAKQQDLSTVYMLTEEGAIRIINGRSHRLVDYKSRDFGPIETTPYKADRADILFVKDSSEGARHPYGGFYGVQHPEQALEILQKYSKK